MGLESIISIAVFCIPVAVGVFFTLWFMIRLCMMNELRSREYIPL